jgi:L-fuconolactonase
MRIVDSHAHVASNWYEPIQVLEDQMCRNNVDRAILTQPLGNFDNGYIEACRHADPERYATIVGIDPSAPDATSAMAQCERSGASGVRLRPGARSRGGDGLDVWRAAGACGLAVSSPGTSADFASAAFGDLVEALPDVTIVLEHLAGGNSPAVSGEGVAARRSAFLLARFPNVFLKVPGIGEVAPRSADRSAAFPFTLPDPDPFTEALLAFGAHRLMWGSDFPVVSSREGYANALRFCRDHFAGCTEAERYLIFGGVADRVFARRP